MWLLSSPPVWIMWLIFIIWYFCCADKINKNSKQLRLFNEAKLQCGWILNWCTGEQRNACVHFIMSLFVCFCQKNSDSLSGFASYYYLIVFGSACFDNLLLFSCNFPFLFVWQLGRWAMTLCLCLFITILNTHAPIHTQTQHLHLNAGEVMTVFWCLFDVMKQHAVHVRSRLISLRLHSITSTV